MTLHAAKLFILRKSFKSTPTYSLILMGNRELRGTRFPHGVDKIASISLTPIGFETSTSSRHVTRHRALRPRIGGREYLNILWSRAPGSREFLLVRLTLCGEDQRTTDCVEQRFFREWFEQKRNRIRLCGQKSSMGIGSAGDQDGR